MKKYIKPPFFSTKFSESGKKAKSRLANILNTKAKKAGAAAVVVILAAAAVLGSMVAFRRSPQTEPEVSLAERLYDLKNEYVGNMSKNREISIALGIASDLGSYNNELQTSVEPYGWSLIFGYPFSEMGERECNDRMKGYACALLALVDNLGYVEWSYPAGEDRASVTFTAEDAADMLGADVKSFGESPERVTELLEKIRYYEARESSTYKILTETSLEDFEKDALVIGNVGAVLSYPFAADNIGKLNEFLNAAAMKAPSALDIVMYHHEGGSPILMRICTDGSSFWGGEYDRGGSEEPIYYEIPTFKHLRIFKEKGAAYFYLVDDENLKFSDIASYLLSSAVVENPPKFRTLFFLEGEEGENYETAIY